MMGIHLVSRLGQSELPIQGNALGLPLLKEGQNFPAQFRLRRNAPIQTSSRQSRKLNLDHVEPTRRLGSKEELKLLREGKRLIGRQGTIEGMAGMRIEIVLHQADFLRLWPMLCQGLTKVGVFLHRAPGIDFGKPFAA